MRTNWRNPMKFQHYSMSRVRFEGIKDQGIYCPRSLTRDRDAALLKKSPPDEENDDETECGKGAILFQ